MKEICNVIEFTANPIHNSIHESISNDEIQNKKRILDYLKSFEPDCAAGMSLTDEISGESIELGVEGYEDGKYYWDTRHIYHFEKYNLKLNDDFVKYVSTK